MKLKRLCMLLLAIVLMLGLCACETGTEEKSDNAGTKLSSVATRTAEYPKGSYVTLGTYPQTASGTDNTPIEWLVLKNDGKTALLISRYALDAQPYNTEYESVTWEWCTLRSWLNDEFYNRAFSDEEKRYILESDVSADDNPKYSTNPGNDTKDNVFLLNIARDHFSHKEAAACIPTEYAIQQGAQTSDSGTCFSWWLRSPGMDSKHAAYFAYDNSIDISGHEVSDGTLAVRPCVQIRLFEYVTFGSYPQTESGADSTPIEWIVLENDGETALLISRYALDSQPYNTEDVDTTWEQCTLRSWLNDEFYNRAFNADEKKWILTSDVSADENPDYSTSPGSATKDNLFLMSIAEAEKYFASDEARMCAATGCAIQQGAFVSSYNEVDDRESCLWWLRSPGDRSDYASCVDTDGSFRSSGKYVNISCAVRPCVRVHISKLLSYYYQNAISLMKEEKYEEAIEVFRALNGYSNSEAKMEACETAILEREYQKAVSLMNSKKYEEAIQVFWALDGYSDSAAKMKACETAILESVYQKAVSLMNEEKYEEAIGFFHELNGYSDSSAQIEACEAAILEREYQKAISLINEEKYEEAIEAFRMLNGYSDSAAQIEACEAAILEREYQKAEKLRENGQYAEAYAIYQTIQRYKDVYETITNDAGIAAARRAAYQPGSYVTFGAYPQTKSATDKTPIEWLVLESDGETALLISRYALDCQPYNTEWEDTTWEYCTLRSWLNNKFYNRAFSTSEKSFILKNSVSADKNPNCNTDPGNDTKDKVFLLSIAEADKYFTSDEARMCAPTDYAIWHGTSTDGRNVCRWWLRSPGDDSGRAACVDSGGSIHNNGSSVDSSSNAVRPCVRVRLSELPSDYDEGNELVTERSNQPFQTAEYRVGSYVTFGTYPQTSSGTDDTPIEWLVLESNSETALLISRYALDCQPYNKEQVAITWEQCTLRSWLNDEFYNRAFSEDEKQLILTSDVSADENPDGIADHGNATQDNVFLLSIVEANKYFTSDEARMCAPTDYAIWQKGAYANSNYKVHGRAACWWWLRSPGDYGNGDATPVLDDGLVYGYGCRVSGSNKAVRPCVRVRLSGSSNDYEEDEATAEERGNQAPKAVEYQIDSRMTFGTYPQTKSGADDTPIEWLVLESDGETALLISRYALDSQPYNKYEISYFQYYTDWEDCTLRGWLNDEFYNRAFSAEEKQRILTSDVSADKNPRYSTDPGNATTDNVFLLSIVEANKYFESDEVRMCSPTDYAIKQGVHRDNDYTADGNGACLWWLRSPGYDGTFAVHVSCDGSVDSNGNNIDSSYMAVRPCVRVRLS